MNRLLKLYKMLNKNNAGDEKMSSKTAVFVIVGAIGAVLLVYVGYKYATILEAAGGVELMVNLGGFATGIVILFLGFVMLINSMYMSNDIELLITMPFSSLEIVILRLLSFLKVAYAVGAVLLLPLNIGFFVATSIDALGLCVVILELLLVPLFATAFTAALIIILMSVIRVFRNKDVLRYIGIAMLFLLLCVYFYISGRGSGSGIDMNSLVSQIESYESTLQYIVPVSGFLVDFYVNKSIVSLLIALVIVAAAVLLLYVVAKYLYLQGALNMQNTSIGGKILDEDELKKISQQKSPYKALVKKEMRSLRRNPVYSLNNFIVGVLWPIIAILAFKGAAKVISSIIVMKEQTPDATYVDMYAVIMEVAILSFLVMLIPCLYANIAYSSLTREGNSFPIMKQIPVAYDIQIKAKMAVAQRVLQFATVYVALFSLFLNWLMDVPIYYSIIPTLMSFLIINMFVCMDMIVGYKKASVGWDNEKKAVDKNSGLLIVVNLLLAFGIPLFCAIGLFLAEKDGDGQPLIMLIPTAIATIIIAIVGVILRKQAIKKGEKRIKTLRF